MNARIQSLPVLVLDVYSRCNCRCMMCDIWKRDAARALTFEDLSRQFPAIERLGVQWVVLTGGEPLMHPDLFRLCDALRSRGIRITLLTTGLLLERYAEQVTAKIDDVIISLDGPREIHNSIRGVKNAFDLLASGIRAIRKHHPSFSIAARSTVQRANCAFLSGTVGAARELGCDSISFLAADTHSSAFDHHAPFDNLDEIRLSTEDIARLSVEIERVIDSGECGGFVAETPEKLRRIANHARWTLGLGDPVAPRCNAPWVSAVMDAEGFVRPCFFHAPIGRLGAGDALDIVLNGPEALAFRGALDIAENPVCRRCVCSLNYRATAQKESSRSDCSPIRPSEPPAPLR
jgi:Fe-coproporphyrin III synthase